jgi:glycosyltransferase involved in cell wall biosynthesis
MKLVIQIPCYDEETSLPVTLAALPRHVPGFESVEWLVVDDGSEDRTAEVARRHGVDHVVRLPFHQGLSKAFMAGLEASLRAGADVIVNTDADNQYDARDIPKLVRPILDGEAQIVVGARATDEIEHFSATKRLLQRLGSWVTRLASRTDIPDAPSGFRAMTRDAALRLNVFSPYTYTLEMIIQAGRQGLPIASVPIRTNEDLRPSRLIKSIPSYIQRSALIILRVFMTYKPLRFFFLLGSVPFTLGVLLGVRWLVYFFEGTSRTRIPSLILTAILILMGFQLWMFGLVADLMDVNRRMLEDLQLGMRRAELGMTGHVRSRPVEQESAAAREARPPAEPALEQRIETGAGASGRDA